MKGLSAKSASWVLLSSLFVLYACSGEGGGCGGPPPEATQSIQCGPGTRQQGNQCVANPRPQQGPPPGSYATPAGANPSAPTQ